MADQATAPPEPSISVMLLDIDDVVRATKIGKRTLWRWIDAGEFPPPDVAKGARIRRWKVETVKAWIDAQKPAHAA